MLATRLVRGVHLARSGFAVLLCATCVITGRAQTSIVPGSALSPYPTYENLAFEWEFSGDSNKNATVDVQYRPVGSGAWSQGMPLRRIPAGSNVGHAWTNKFSGSLFDLNPGTQYEVQLSLNDPNGGSTVQTLNAQTRSVPKLNQGTIVELAPGSHGTLNVVSGTPGNPMIYRSQDPNNPADVSFVNMSGKHDVYVVGLNISSLNGTGIDANGASNYVIAQNTINARHGVRALSNATNGYIVDNVIQGQTTWQESSLGVSGNNVGEGIEISGPGNVIAHNFVKGFRDNISTLEGSSIGDQRSIDILNNDIRIAADDAIEADFTQGNVRVMRNRITDAFIGISTQPSLGGPTYLIRNTLDNIVHVPLKPYRNSNGDVVLHNTIVKAGSGLYTDTGSAYANALFRNNLAIGGENLGNFNGFAIGNSRPADLRTCIGSCDFDYDAVGVTTAASSPNLARIYNPSSTPFLTEEPNGIILTGIDAADMSPLFLPGVSQPTTRAEVLSEHSPQDLRLGLSSPVEGQAELIPGLNDGFLGTGPDMGAFEAGQELVAYGPRTQLAGDYDGDFDVDLDDYSAWVTHFGETVSFAGRDSDGNSNGVVDAGDYTVWRDSFLVAQSALANGTSIPEPSAALLVGMAFLMLPIRRHF